VLIVGSQLEHAAFEVRSIGDLYESVTNLTPSRATAKRVVKAVDGAWLAHFATHHQHRRENPLFGSLELTDGPLYLHDLLRVRLLPHVVVLSACKAAEGTTGPVGDVLGASTVLMERGTSTVIASPSLVADSRSHVSSMTTLHRRFIAGDPPAVALRTVRQQAGEIGRRERALAAGFVCYGAGW
jgi:CHAT domain-containing protein